MGKFIDRTGAKVGKLTVIKLGKRSNRGDIRWWCRCECGNNCLVWASSLTSGHTLSCGCYKRLRTSQTHRTHQMSNTRFYKTWADVVSRCQYKGNKYYKNYGGRGIQVCNSWKLFQVFRKDMYKSYLAHSKIHGERNTTIDRINVNGNYSLSNCKWATRQEQVRNKRTNRKIKFSGKTMVLSDWAKEYGLNKSSLWRKVVQKGVPLPEAISSLSATRAVQR